MNRKDWFRYFAPRFVTLAAVMGFILRIVLIFMPQTVRDFGFLDILRIFGLGLLNDVAFSAIALVPAFVIYSLMTSAKYRKPAGYLIEGLLVALAVYVIGFNDITDEYGGVVPGIADALVAIILICFSIKLFVCPPLHLACSTSSVQCLSSSARLCSGRNSQCASTLSPSIIWCIPTR